MGSFTRHRRWIGWLCVAAFLWMGLAAQRHLLSHAIDAVHAADHPAVPVEHAMGCVECLQFAGFDSVVAASPALLPAFGGVPSGPSAADSGWRPEAFVAYASRAPPAA